jgi:GntR family transcriptional regulator
VARSKTQWLIDDISAQIESGRLQPGDRLPSTSELRTQYGVSITVVRNAVQWLKAKGLVEGLSGVGVFVVERKDKSGD